MTQLGIKNGVSYELLNQSNLTECIDLMSQVFSIAEPLTRLVGITTNEFRFFAKVNCEKALKEKLAVLARDEKTGELLGFNISEDLGTPPPIEIKDITSKFDPIVDILGLLVDKFSKSYTIEPGKFMHIFMIGLKPSKTHPFLAVDLMQAGLDQARILGYQGAIGEVTSYLSARLGKRCGFQERASIYYDEYEWQGEKVFAELGHTSCRLMVQIFDQDSADS